MSWKLKINGTFFISLIFLIVSLFLVVAVVSRQQNYSKVFMPREGRLELSERDFRYSILLSGEWEFYESQLLNGSGDIDAATEYVMVPHIWDGTGYGSYRLLVEGLNPEQCYSLSVPDMGGAYRLFVNGEEKGSNGEVAASKASERLHWEPGILTFRPGRESVEIVMQVSNFHSFPGGFLREMKLGLPTVIQREQKRKLSGELVLLGGLLIVALYNICLFILNPSNLSTLYFTLFNLSVSLRMLITGEKIINLLFQELNWLPLLGLQYITGALMLAFFILFMNSLFQAEFHRRIVILFLSLTALFLGREFFFPWFCSGSPIPFI